jgi:hypothetical protein
MGMEIVASFTNAVLSGIRQVLKLLGRTSHRQRLIEDLEILSKTPESIEQRRYINEHIERSITRLYADPMKSQSRRIDWSGIIVVGVFGLGFGYWTYHLSKDAFSGWSLLTGLFALGAVEAVIKEFRGESGKILNDSNESAR